MSESNSPFDTQTEGNYYSKLAIQPMDYSMLNGLDSCQHTAIKYITRFRDKKGIQDLEKAKHTIDMLIGYETHDMTLVREAKEKIKEIDHA